MILSNFIVAPANASALHHPDFFRYRHRAAPCRFAALRSDWRERHEGRAGRIDRVALKEKSLVVNSSQGGGTKDTWIVEDSIFDENFPSQSQSQST